jgi:hypothetical protein
MNGQQYLEYAACPDCGSTAFYEADVRQYRTGYSSTPGAVRVQASEPIPVRFCICGHPTLRVTDPHVPERGEMRD